MKEILTIAILFVVGLSVLYFVSNGDNNFFKFAAGIVEAVKKRLLRKRPEKQPHKTTEPRKENVLLDSKIKNNMIFARSDCESFDCKHLDIIVFDRQNNQLGSTRLAVSKNPVVIGRGDAEGGENKLCLPELSKFPRTSRKHCTISLVNGNPILKDCYTYEESIRNGKQVHSISFVNGEYVGCGISITKAVKVDIGDYLLLIKPVKSSIPTFGADEYRNGKIKTFGVDDEGERTKATAFSSRKSSMDFPTKEFHLNK